MASFLRRISNEVERVTRRVNGEVVRVSDRVVAEVRRFATADSHETFMTEFNMIVQETKLLFAKRIPGNNQEDQDDEGNDGEYYDIISSGSDTVVCNDRN